MLLISMIRLKLSLVLVIITVISLLTGCEKITASMDGLEKEATESAPEAAPEVVEPEVEENNDDILTGGLVAETEEPKSATHTVKMTAEGFSPDKLFIKAGDTVEWKNTRYGTVNKAMIIGVRECRQVRSSFLKPGESFSFVFDQPIECTIADGVMTTKESKIVVT